MERHVVERSVLTQALRKITYGFYILTTHHQGKVAAGTVVWVSQASFDPPLVMVGVKVDSHLHDMIEHSGVFALNIVGRNEKHMVSPFFKDTQVEGYKLNGFPVQPGVTGCPLLIDLPAFLECKVFDFIRAGDHSVILGEVVNAGARHENEVPLVEWETNWHYGG